MEDIVIYPRYSRCTYKKANIIISPSTRGFHSTRPSFFKDPNEPNKPWNIGQYTKEMSEGRTPRRGVLPEEERRPSEWSRVDQNDPEAVRAYEARVLNDRERQNTD